LSTGKWRSNDDHVKLTRIKGKFIHYMGTNRVDDEQNRATDFLHLEEALFLLESVSIYSLVYLKLHEACSLIVTI
jgi:hypothetical protein